MSALQCPGCGSAVKAERFHVGAPNVPVRPCAHPWHEPAPSRWDMPNTDPLAVLVAIAGEVLPRLLAPGASDAEKNALVAAFGPDVLAAVGAMRQQKERATRADFIAHHAVLLAQTAVETSEGDEALREVAKRSVRLAQLIWDSSHKGEA